MEKKRILFFIYQMGAGGAARTFLNILNNLDEAKFAPILVTLNYDGDYEKYLNKNVKFIKLKSKRLRSSIFELSKVIRGEKVDIVFSTIPNYNTIAILANLFSFTPAKNVVREAAYLGGTRKANFKLLLYGFLYKFTKKVIALSQGVKDNIVTRYKVKREKIEVIYNPIDLEQIEKSIQNGTIDEKHKHIFNNNEKVIVSAGRLVDDKDQQTLIKAFARVREKVKAKLIILGEGELENELKQVAKELGVEDYVYFLGFQQNPYIYFANADVFVLTSKREGFGHVLAEALAVGIPIVSTKAKPGAIEVLQNGKYGLLCEIGNEKELTEKILETFQWEEDKRKEVIAKGKEHVKSFDAQSIVKQYEKVFLKVLQ